MKYRIDINADLGEGYPFDAEIMPFISSCSIACGGHFGDENSIKKTIQLAKKYNVKVGAHPSFPDRENFGRKVMKIEEEPLIESLVQQMQLFLNLCESESVVMNHVKLHGALYNLASVDEKTSEVVIKAIQKVNLDVSVYVPYNTILFAKAKPFFTLIPECFIDRSYTDEGYLVNRKEPGALIETPEGSLIQLVDIVTRGQVKSFSGKRIPMKGETFCIHGDNRNALAILKNLRSKLNTYSIEIS
jgi:UPF0271 protein